MTVPAVSPLAQYPQYYSYYGEAGHLPPPPPGTVDLASTPPPPPGTIDLTSTPPPPPGTAGYTSTPPLPPGTVTYSSAPPPPPGIISYTLPPPIMSASYIAPLSGSIPDQSSVSTKLSADSDTRKRKLNEEGNPSQEKPSKKTKSQSNDQTVNSSQHGGITEQEYNYSHYYQNYYAQYNQQQPNYLHGQTVTTEQHSPADDKSNAQ